MDPSSRLFSDSKEGLTPAHAPEHRQRTSYHPNHELLTYLSVREEELWAGTGSHLLLG
jgi:hypothetical protein